MREKQQPDDGKRVLEIRRELLGIWLRMEPCGARRRLAGIADDLLYVGWTLQGEYRPAYLHHSSTRLTH